MKNFIYSLNALPAFAGLAFAAYTVVGAGVPDVSTYAPLYVVSAFAIIGAFAVSILNPRM